MRLRSTCQIAQAPPRSRKLRKQDRRPRDEAARFNVLSQERSHLWATANRWRISFSQRHNELLVLLLGGSAMRVNEDMENFIDVLHAIKFERYHGGSGAEAQAKIDVLIANLVAGQRNMTSGMPTVFAEIAKRILEAEANWNRETGKSYCGQMTQAG